MIDREFLAGFTGGDDELEAELIGFFVENATLYMTELENAEPGEPWRMVSHKLKGAARSVGAVVVSDLALVSETLNSADTTLRSEMISELYEAIDCVRKMKL